VEVRALTTTNAATIASWRYPDRYSTYDVDDPSVLARDHWAVTDAGQLVGYCCFGEPARVPEAHAEPGTLDVGYGMAPDRMGRQQGHCFVGAILEFAVERYQPRRLRLYILEWNARSRKVAARLGFGVDSVLHSDEGGFVVMIRHERR
jgi:[ribosomal protein S18]-alanine N-acetyltransferase